MNINLASHCCKWFRQICSHVLILSIKIRYSKCLEQIDIVRWDQNQAQPTVFGGRRMMTWIIPVFPQQTWKSYAIGKLLRFINYSRKPLDLNPIENLWSEPAFSIPKTAFGRFCPMKTQRFVQDSNTYLIKWGGAEVKWGIPPLTLICLCYSMHQYGWQPHISMCCCQQYWYEVSTMLGHWYNMIGSDTLHWFLQTHFYYEQIVHSLSYFTFKDFVLFGKLFWNLTGIKEA